MCKAPRGKFPAVWHSYWEETSLLVDTEEFEHK